MKINIYPEIFGLDTKHMNLLLRIIGIFLSDHPKIIGDILKNVVKISTSV